MKNFYKILLISFTIIITISFFNKKIIEKYIIFKFSKWVQNTVVIDDIQIEYTGKLSIKGLKILSPNSTYYDYIFETDKVNFNIDLKSYFFENLVIIKELTIKNPKFFLEVYEKKANDQKSDNTSEEIFYEDNIGIAKKLTQNLPDKVWPKKIKDKNFLIIKCYINNGIGYLKISNLSEQSIIPLSNFEFSKIGNHNNFQHYKDSLKVIFFDFFGREPDLEKKKILKKIYKL